MGFATFFAEAAQLEMYGDDGDCRWPLIYQATGSARKVDGGYLVNGAWDYASGIQISNWLGVVCTQGDRESQPIGYLNPGCVVPCPVDQISAVDLPCRPRWPLIYQA